MLELTLLKCHGSNNDFIIIDEMEELLFSDSERKQLALLLCNRTTGIGADGILFVLSSDTCEAKMRVFNADGSEASMCGNGLRCVARYVCEKLDVESAVIETMRANLRVRKEESIYGELPTYLVEISPVSFELRDLPLLLSQKQLINERIEGLSDLKFTALAVPNPHIVTVVSKEQLNSTLQEDISLLVNQPNDWFPDGVNVSFVQPLSKGNIFVRTFERGVGFTNACGTAMSASTLVTCLLGYNELGEVVDVYNPGGKVRCVAHLDDDKYKIDLIGNATYTNEYNVTFEENQMAYSIIKERVFTQENENYRHLEEHAKQIVTNVK